VPNGGTHIIAGALLGGAASVVIQKKLHESERIDLGQVVLTSGSGALAGRIPDILEPPTNPNHRAFFHSWLFGGLLGFVIAEFWRSAKRKREEGIEEGIEDISGTEIWLAIGMIVLLAIMLHVIMDGFTTKGLSPV
jgi:membrane-bound metal-dependent hydrolase YbcI (DUF457 family)